MVAAKKLTSSNVVNLFGENIIGACARKLNFGYYGKSRDWSHLVLAGFAWRNNLKFCFH